MTGDNPDFFAYVLYYMAMIEARRGELEQAVEKLEQALRRRSGKRIGNVRDEGDRLGIHEGRKPRDRR